jgi:glycosyltransferase involved in cell wall biosynthesis
MLVRALRASRPDVIHVHASLVSPLAATAAWVGARIGAPTVITVHSVWSGWARAIYRRADNLVGWRDWPVLWTTVSEASAAAMRPLLPAGPVVVPNAIDLPFWRPRERAAQVRPGLHVVAVGRLAPRKRPMDIVRVLRDARRRLPTTVPLRATIVGDGPERGRIARFLADHRMGDWVSLTGRLDPAAVRDLLADADVFLAPATLESFGIAAMEARTAGLPVLARAGTGVADFVSHEREGLLAPDRDGLVHALVRLGRDPGLQAAITDHNRATTPERFGWPAVVAEIDACYARSRILIGHRPLTPVAAHAGLLPTTARPVLRS